MTSLGHNSLALVCFRGLVGSGGCLTHLTLRNQMKIRESVGYFCNLKSIMYISIYNYTNSHLLSTSLLFTTDVTDMYNGVRSGHCSYKCH